jgi:hypothetical protein
MAKELLAVTEQKTQQSEINCFTCQHFYITHDQSFPYGCKAVGFKSRLMPAKEMYVNSGIECQLYKEKE